MLRIYDELIALLRAMRGLVTAIERRDRDLGNQLRRALSSAALNTAEGSGSFDGVRRARYRTALGSARESISCLQVAEAFGYIDDVPTWVLDPTDRIIGTLVKVTR